MPVSIDIRKALVFGGERGEGLQKTQKLSLFADEILVVPETSGPTQILVPKGYPSELKEKLFLDKDRIVPVHHQSAGQVDLESLIVPQAGLFVVSDLADRSLNEKISKLCIDRGILCNIIDTKDLCTVWFMSLIQTPYLSIGLSTRGGAAYYSARMREEWQLEVEDRDRVAGILTELRNSLPKGMDRYPVLDGVYKDKKFQKLIRRRRWKKAKKQADKIKENLCQNTPGTM